MQREERHFHGDGDEEAEEEPERSGSEESDGSGGEQLLNLGEVEGSRLRVKPDDGCQHEHRRDHRVEEKLDGCVDAALVSEDADYERHGNERGFPEEVKKEKVECDENADHGGFKHEQKDKEF